MPAYTRDMSTNHSTRPATSASHPNPTEGGTAPALLWGAHPADPVYGVHIEHAAEPAPMPIYLGAANTPATEGSQHPTTGAYDPGALLRHLVLLWALLLGLTLALGGWQPHTSDARLGWSHGSISVVEGTDGDTGARPLDPHDEGVLPAPPNATLRSVSPDSPAAPVEMPGAFFGDTSRLAPSVAPWSGGSRA